MDFESLIRTFPEIGITFTESALAHVLKTKDVHVLGDTQHLVPKGSPKLLDHWHVIKEVSHIVRYEVVYVKWKALVTENWTEDVIKQYVPSFSALEFDSKYLLFYVKPVGNTFKFYPWSDETDDEITDKSELLECESKYEMVAVKKIENVLFQYS